MTSLRLTRRTMLATVAAIALASPVDHVAAQALVPQPVTVTHDSDRKGSTHSERFAGGFALVGMQPLDEFRQFVDAGGGIQGHVLYALDPMGIVNLRADIAFVNYGSERRSVPLSPAYGNLIRIDLTTTNNIGVFGGGLQLQSPSGPLRPYAAATAGWAWFWTQSTLDGESESDGEGFARTTNSRDATFAWSGTGGIVIPLGKSRAWGLDLGATYTQVKDARYMHEGSIREVDGIPYADEPVRSRADMMAYRVGVRFGR